MTIQEASILSSTEDYSAGTDSTALTPPRRVLPPAWASDSAPRREHPFTQSPPRAPEEQVKKDITSAPPQAPADKLSASPGSRK